MRRKPGIAGLIREKEQQSAYGAVGEQLEVRRNHSTGLRWHRLDRSSPIKTSRVLARDQTDMSCRGIREPRLSPRQSLHVFAGVMSDAT